MSMLFPKHAFQSQTADPSGYQCNAILEAANADTIVLDVDFLASTYAANPKKSIASVIRKINPEAAIFGYFSPADYQPYDSEIMLRFRAGFDPDWLVRSVNGAKEIVLYTNPANGQKTKLMNLTKPALRRHIVNTLTSFDGLSPGAGVDGIYFDWACPVSWLANDAVAVPGGIDLYGNHTATPQAVIDAEWRDAWNALAVEMKSRKGCRVVGNGGYQAARGYRVDGLMIEGFMTNSPAPGQWSSWSQVMRSYVTYTGSDFPHSFIMQTSNAPAGTPSFYAAQRFAVASACLFDGGIVLNSGTQYVDRFWTDELGVDCYGQASKAFKDRRWMGRALNDAYDSVAGPSVRLADVLMGCTETTNLEQAEARLYRRDFENAVVLVNPSATLKTANFPAQATGLGTGLRLIKGIADPAVNTGAVVPVGVLSVPAKSGLILFRQ